MPGGDGTGPMGLGPMTGRGMGYCVLSNKKTDGVCGYAGINGKPIYQLKPFIHFYPARTYWPPFMNLYNRPYIGNPYLKRYTDRRFD